MRMHISHITVAIGVAALTVACAGGTTTVNMTEERATSSANRGANQRLELIGCVAPSTSATEGKYLLTHVIPPPGAMVPQVSASSDEPLIPRGSSVRLGASYDMKPYVGKEVEISADLVGAGQPAVGTSGSTATGQNTPPPAGDLLADIPKGSYANADMPEIAVETVKVQPGKCTEY
jgi:hypothetical protein